MGWGKGKELQIMGNTVKIKIGLNNVNNHVIKSIDVPYCSKPFIHNLHYCNHVAK